MVKDPRRLSDGFTELSGGCDSGLSPSIIRPNQVAFAVNAQMRGGFIKPRPGINHRVLQFPGIKSSLFEDGKFQGAKTYRTATGDDVLMAAISGRMFKVDIADQFSVQDITIPASPNSSLLEYTFMEQAENFFIMQDGVSAAYIFDGASARRTQPGEIPTGTVMNYQLGRLWIASPDRRQFVAGDLVYGPSGTAAYNYRDAVLKMSENDLLVTGGAFSIPDNAGEITAMLAPAILDTVTGQSALQVFTRTTGFSVNAPIDRATWKTLTYPVQTVSLKNFGPIGQNSLVRVNSDIWFRSTDGVRSFVLARRNFSLAGQNTWANTPSSDELRTILDYDQQEILDHASAVNFDNRLLMTVSPVWTSKGTYFRGLLSLDFSVISGMSRQSPPAWEGLWTGVKILQILTAMVNRKERCFMFTLSSDNKIQLWELSRADKQDNGSKRIVWSHEDRSFQFLSNGAQTGLKRLMTGQQSVDELYGPVSFNLQFRPDQYPLWLDWTAWSECSTFQDCSTPTCGNAQIGPQQHRLQYRPDIKFPQPPDSCEADVSKPFNLGFEFQTRQTIEGYCRIKKLVLHTHWVDESPLGECRGEGPCQSVVGCDINPFTYTAE
jgi:hypothetical protein